MQQRFERATSQEKELHALEAELKDWADPVAKRNRLAEFSKTVDELVAQVRVIAVWPQAMVSIVYSQNFKLKYQLAHLQQVRAGNQ